MTQLLGEYEVKLDSKGRFRVPTALLSQLGEESDLGFVINRGFEKNLMLYPKKVWDAYSEEVNNLNSYNKDNLKFIRYFYRGAQKVSKDSSDRILVNKRLLDYAGIKGEMVLLALNNRIEIWANETYQLQLEEEPEDFADIASHVMGGINPES